MESLSNFSSCPYADFRWEPSFFWELSQSKPKKMQAGLALHLPPQQTHNRPLQHSNLRQKLRSPRRMLWMLLSQKLPTSPRSSLHHRPRALMARKVRVMDAGIRQVEQELCFNRRLAAEQPLPLETLRLIKPIAETSVFMPKVKSGMILLSEMFNSHLADPPR